MAPRGSGALPSRLDRLCRSDPFLVSLATAAREANARLLLVGGVIRDMRLGRVPRDADFILMGRGRRRVLRQLPALAGGRVVTFRKRGLIDHRVIAGGREHDLVEVTAGTLRRELGRRDFTINAIAWDIQRRRLVDPRGGLRDADRRRLRMTSPRVFEDDPLRMLRAVRLRCELPRFTIERDTRRRMRRDAPRLGRVSPERIREELDRILASPQPASGIREADRLGLLTIVIPEVELVRGLRQNRYHHLDAWRHTLAALQAASDLASLARGLSPALPSRRGPIPAGGAGRLLPLPRERVLVLRWALLFHDLGKAATRTIGEDREYHFFGHEKRSATLAAGIMKRLKFTNRRTRAIRRLVELHLRIAIPAEGDLSEKACRRLIRDAGDLTPLLVLHSLADKAASQGSGWRAAMARLRKTGRTLLRTWREYGEAILAPPRLLDGHDVMRLCGIGPGPRVGAIIEEIRMRQIAGEISTREQAEEAVPKIGPPEHPPL